MYSVQNINKVNSHSRTWMFKYTKLVFLIILMLQTSFVFSQVRLSTTQYYLNKLTYNAAYAGASDKFDVIALYRNQYVGQPGGPTKFLAILSTPIKNTNSNVGLNIDYDKMGPLRQYEICGSYAYRIYTDHDYSISFGLRGGIVRGEVNTTELDGYKISDPKILASNGLYTQAIFGAGTYFESNRMAFGLSVPNLLVDNFDIYANNTDFRSEFKGNFIGEYLIDINRKYSLKPSTLLRYNSRSPFGYDFNLYFIYKHFLWIGAGYRSEDIITANVMLVLNENVMPNLSNEIRFGYSYDINRGLIRNATGASHELTLGYYFNRKYARDRVISVNPRSF